LPRTLVVSLAPATLIASVWLRLEAPVDRPERAIAVAGLALVPALVRPLAARVVAALVAAVLAAWVAFGVSPLHPRHLPGTLWHRFENGFLDFYDVRMPFDPRVHPDMRGVVLAAVFGFVLAVACAVAARRPVLAAVLVVVGAGWPATLRGSGAFVVGAATLLTVLIVFAGLTTRHVPRIAVPVGIAVVLLAVAASTSAAVGKSGILAWQHWDPYNAPEPPVSVAFVWNADYSGLHWPAKRTTVLQVQAPRRSVYWRATVLDDFAGGRWRETLPLRGDALVPSRGKSLLKQQVTVLALADSRLVGASDPVRFDAGDAPITSAAPGVAQLSAGLTHGFRYTVWSYAPQPTSAALATSKPVYPIELTEPGAFLEIAPGRSVPAFGVPNRRRTVLGQLDDRYGRVAKTAFAVAGRAATPYAAAAALESWFRTTGGFTYTNDPPRQSSQPLVDFVTRTRTGDCQHFAGAMALMLRYLGVPARVAVGFSSGTYHDGVWTVTDRDAHAWVEAWFRGYGWLPFDPTPALGRPERGELSAPYAAAQRLRVQGASDVPRFGPGARTQRGAHSGATPGAGVKFFGPARRAVTGSWRRSLVAVLVLLAAAAAAAIALAKLVVRNGRYATRDPRRIAAACRRELADYLVDQRIDTARSATLHELGALVRHELAVDPDAFVAAATAARFGPPHGADAAARRSRRELRALRRNVRVRLRARDRVRGLLSLRSFGFAP